MSANPKIVMFHMENGVPVMPYLLEDIVRKPDGSISDAWVINGAWRFGDKDHSQTQFSKEIPVPEIMHNRGYKEIALWAEKVLQAGPSMSISPIGYVWEEAWTDPATHMGPAEYNSELTFDTSPPKEGTAYIAVFQEQDLKAIRLQALEDVAALATVGATYEELMMYLQDEIAKCQTHQNDDTPAADVPRG